MIAGKIIFIPGSFFDNPLSAVIKLTCLIFLDKCLVIKKKFFSTPPPSIEGIKIISFLGSQNVKINDITTDDGDLEEVFIKLTKS